MPWSRSSPFVIGMIGAAGVAVTIAGVELLIAAREVLVLIGLAMFIALGLEPAVTGLTRHRLPRWAAVTSVCLGGLAVTGGLLAISIPTLVSQGAAFVDQVPHYIQKLQDRSSLLGQLNERFHIQQAVRQALTGDESSIVSGVLGAGAVVVGALGSTVVVSALGSTLVVSSAMPLWLGSAATCWGTS